MTCIQRKDGSSRSTRASTAEGGACGIWEGVLFVNLLDTEAAPWTVNLGEMARGSRATRSAR